MRLKPKGGAGGEPSGGRLPQGSEETYESPQPVDFRGDFKPELVQLLMRLRLQEGMKVPEGLAPLTAEQLRELMEKSVEITVGAMAEGDLSSAVGLFLTNLEKEAGMPIPDEQVEVKDGQPVADVAARGEGRRRGDARSSGTTSGTSAPPTTSRAGVASSSGRWKRATRRSSRRRCVATARSPPRRASSSSSCGRSSSARSSACTTARTSTWTWSSSI